MSEGKKRTKRAHAADESMSLEENIASQRRQLLAARREAPQLRSRAQALRREAEGMTRRWEARRRGVLLEDACALEAEAGVRESMQREHHFEATAVTYLRTYHKRIVEPGDTVESFVRSNDATRQRKAAILDEFLTEVSRAPARVAMATRDECPRCASHTKLLLCAAKSLMTCPTCGYAVTYLDATSSSTAFDDVVDYSQDSYKRINHYTRHIALCQGKEAHRVPDDILHTVMKDLYHRQGVRSADEITFLRVRESLRKLKLRKAYDHAVQVAGRLIGRPPPRVTPLQEEKLKAMFLKMQPAFQRHAPSNRTNFLSYSYVLYRSFQILGLTHMIDSVCLLKGRDKLEANDAIWARMSEDLGWPVFPLPAA